MVNESFVWIEIIYLDEKHIYIIFIRIIIIIINLLLHVSLLFLFLYTDGTKFSQNRIDVATSLHETNSQAFYFTCRASCTKYSFFPLLGQMAYILKGCTAWYINASRACAPQKDFGRLQSSMLPGQSLLSLWETVNPLLLFSRTEWENNWTALILRLLDDHHIMTPFIPGHWKTTGSHT